MFLISPTAHDLLEFLLQETFTAPKFHGNFIKSEASYLEQLYQFYKEQENSLVAECIQ